MKIRRSLINPLYEDDSEEQQEETRKQNEIMDTDSLTEIQPEPFENEPEYEEDRYENEIEQRKPKKSLFSSLGASFAQAANVVKPKPRPRRIKVFNQQDAQLIEPILVNQPISADIPKEERVIHTRIDDTPVSRDQLIFEITPKKPSLQDRLEFIRVYFERRQELLEISMLWKNPALPFMIVSLIAIAGILFIGGIFEFDRIPLSIPVFYNHVEKSWEQSDKSIIFIAGIVIVLIEGFLLNVITKIFRSDRRFALTLSWMVTFINALILIAALQIYALIT